MQDNRDWDELPLTVKLRLFKFWYSFSFLGNFVQILGSSIILIGELQFVMIEYVNIEFFLVGLSCAIAWLQMLGYIEYNNSITLITSTLSKSFILILIFYGLYVPMLMAFAYLGMLPIRRPSLLTGDE